MDSDVTNIADHVAVLRRRWRLPLLGLLLGVGVSIGISQTQDVLYTAESRLLLEPLTEPQSSSVMNPDEVSTQADVVTSTRVAAMVIEELGMELSPEDLLRVVEVEAVDNTRIVSITVVMESAEDAAEVANTFPTAYIQLRAEALTATRAQEQESYAAALAGVSEDLRAAKEALSKATNPATRDSLQAQVSSLVAQEAALNIQVAMAGTSNNVSPGQVLRDATVPAAPSSPKPVRGALLGGFLGLVVGVLLAYARDRIDDRFRHEAQLRQSLGTVPILGRIPPDGRRHRERPVTLVAPRSPASEAYRAVTTNIRFLTSTRGHDGPQDAPLLVVTSPVSGEGKTTTAANLALAAAGVGTRVVLVDADLREPGVAATFGIEVPRGLAHVLAGQADVADVLTDVGVPNLRILGVGAVPPNPAELLASDRARKTWRLLRRTADLVIVDTAPLLQVADTFELVPHADHLLLAVRRRVSRAHLLADSLERIRQLGAGVSGVVWLDAPGQAMQYGYGATSQRAEEPVAPSLT